MAITAEQLPDVTFRFHGRANDITIQKNKALEPFGKQVLNYGQVLRLLPTPEQAQDLNQQIGNARFVRNRYLEERIRLYQEKKLSLGVERIPSKTEGRKPVSPKVRQIRPGSSPSKRRLCLPELLFRKIRVSKEGIPVQAERQPVYHQTYKQQPFPCPG